MHETLVLVFDRGDAAARLHFRVRAKPLCPVDVGQVVTQWPVTRHACGFTKKNLADVDGDIGMRIHVIGKRSHFRVERVFVSVAATVAVELNMREVGLGTLQRFHRFERRHPIARHAEIVAVDVYGVR